MLVIPQLLLQNLLDLRHTRATTNHFASIHRNASPPSYSIEIEHSGSSNNFRSSNPPTVAAPHAVTSSLFNVLLSLL